MLARTASSASRLGLRATRQFPIASVRHVSSGQDPQQAAGGASGGTGTPNPMSFLDNMPAPFLEAAKKLQQEAASGAEAARKFSQDAADKLPGQLPLVSDLKGLANPNVEKLSKVAVPLFASFLVLSRNGKLAEEHKALLADVLPPPAQEMLLKVVEMVPEDPAAIELRRIADALEAIEARLGAQAGAESRHAETKPQAPAEPASTAAPASSATESAGAPTSGAPAAAEKK